METASPTPEAELAAAIYRNRRARARHFDADLFFDPGWDMLLELFVAGAEGRRVSVKEACAAACCPLTTGLRWLALLEERGLVIKLPDGDDRRRTYISLSTRARRLMRRYLADREAAR